MTCPFQHTPHNLLLETFLHYNLHSQVVHSSLICSSPPTIPLIQMISQICTFAVLKGELICLQETLSFATGQCRMFKTTTSHASYTLDLNTLAPITRVPIVVPAGVSGDGVPGAVGQWAASRRRAVRVRRPARDRPRLRTQPDRRGGSRRWTRPTRRPPHPPRRPTPRHGRWRGSRRTNTIREVSHNFVTFRWIYFVVVNVSESVYQGLFRNLTHSTSHASTFLARSACVLLASDPPDQ